MIRDSERGPKGPGAQKEPRIQKGVRPFARRTWANSDADERLSAPQALEHPWFAASHEPGTDPLQGSQSFKEFNAMRKLKSAARKIVLANGVAKEWRARARS